MTDHSPPRPATTLAPLRVMQLIKVLASAREGMSLGELSQWVEAPKSSVLSLLRTLSTGGYVAVKDGCWQLGQESHLLGTSIVRSRPFPANLHALLTDLYQQCGETVLIAVPSDDWREVVYVDLIESERSLRFKVEVGSRDPVYCTATGLAMLAFTSEERRANYIGSVELKRRTEGTITSRAQMTRFLEGVRKSVVVVSSGSNPNVTGIAAPLLDADGAVMAVSLAGLTADLERRRAKLVEMVKRTGAAMSERLGCKQYPPGV